MRHSKEEASCSISSDQGIDIITAVTQCHGLSSSELNKLLRDSENFSIQCSTEKGLPIQIDMDRLARFLPLHLIAVLLSSDDSDEAWLRHMLSGCRLLHSLCDLASRHTKLEQILLDDVKVSEQLLDLVMYLLIVNCSYEKEINVSSPFPLVHSTLVACGLYLLTASISSQWQDLVYVLLAHPKVDILMDVAFRAVRLDIGLLQFKLAERSTPIGEQLVNHLCQQCEASLQFLLSLCQQKLFRERLIRNKELCGKGGVLFLVRAILNLDTTSSYKESPAVVAAVSRLKSKVLTILLHLCETEGLPFLDEVATSSESLDLAKSVALQVLELLKTTSRLDPPQPSACSDRTYPVGLVQLNALRLADIFSDDSNFRSFITTYCTEVWTSIFSVPHEEFLSSWCSSDNLKEEDASLEYDPFAAAGWVLDSFSSPNHLDPFREPTFIPNNMPQASYAHQRTSLLVKVIANLHCFVPTICEEQERNLFLRKFLECLEIQHRKLPVGTSFAPNAQKAATACQNLRALLGHAETLVPSFLSEEDVQLVRVFFNQLQPLTTPAEFEMNQDQVQSSGGCLSPLQRGVDPDVNNTGTTNPKDTTLENSAQDDESLKQQWAKDKGKDIQNDESSGSDSSSLRENIAIDPMDTDGFPKSIEQVKDSGEIVGEGQEDEKEETIHGEEKQKRKRKRNIMNEKQITLIEKALLDEPEMQRNAALLQSWADKLSAHGSELTSSQLKNWLNNRKARLARAAAAKDVRAPSEGDSAFPDKQSDSAESPEEFYGPSTVRGTHQRIDARENPEASSAEDKQMNGRASQHGPHEPGQRAMLVNGQGKELGKGKLYQVKGKWYGRSLEETGTCVVDVVELKVEKWARVPYPCEATGASFDEAETKIGVMRVLWDSNKIIVLQPQ